MLWLQQVSMVLAEGDVPRNRLTGKKCSPSPLPPVAKERVVVTVFQKNSRGSLIWVLAGDLIEALEADELRDLRVGVQAIERIAALRERLEHAACGRIARPAQVLLPRR